MLFFSLFHRLSLLLLATLDDLLQNNESFVKAGLAALVVHLGQDSLIHVLLTPSQMLVQHGQLYSVLLVTLIGEEVAL